jgi:preprotein translocase subunit SecA
VYRLKEEVIGAPLMRMLEKRIVLQTLDASWQDHLETMDHLKEGIGLRAYGQRNPLIEYQREGYNLFTEMGENVKGEVLSKLFRVQLVRDDEVGKERPTDKLNLIHRDFTGSMAMAQAEEAEKGAEPQTPEMAPPGEKQRPVVREGVKVGRNDPCPCGSGKKYKKCCGRMSAAG